MTLQIKTTLLLFFAFTISGFAQSNCRDLRGCERKLCELKTQLEYAKQYGRTGKIRGLENAIQNVQRKCGSGSNTTSSNGSYNGNYNSYYTYDIDEKILDKEKKVRERTFELNEAIRENQKIEKIEKRKRKLEEAKIELEETRKLKKL